MTTLTVFSQAPETIYSAEVNFIVDHYSDRKNLGYATFLRSPVFTVGGYEWTLHYYPDGRTEETEGHVSVALELMSTENVPALLSLTFADQVDRTPWAGWPTTVLLNNNNQFLFRWPEVKTDVFEQMELVSNDSLEIKCHDSVIRRNQLLKAGLLPEVEVPASDMFQNLGNFIADQVPHDVAFKVAQETFQAHRIMLAACSPVFNCQLSGQMREDMGDIVVHDIQPFIFRALLHFVYTESVIDMSDMALPEQIEVIRHLLVAADRYCMDRLKSICEGILCRCLDMESLLTSVALADQYQCKKLLVACVEFLKYSAKSDMVDSQWYQVTNNNDPGLAAEFCNVLDVLRVLEN